MAKRIQRGVNAILALTLLCCISIALYVMASTTTYTEPWATSVHGWTFTQLTCTGTCTSQLVTSDGNPADSVSFTLTGKSKTATGYWTIAQTWNTMGVPVGDTIDTVDGSWDSKRVQTTGTCTTSTTAGIQIFDSANTTQCSATAIEPSIDVSGDSAWTNHNPTGAVTINQAACTPSANTVTLRMNDNAATSSTTGTICELRVDNFSLVIVSHPPASFAPGLLTRGVGFHITRFSLE